MKRNNSLEPGKGIWHLVGIPVLVVLTIAAATMRAPVAAPVAPSQVDTDIRIDLGVASVRVTIS